MICDQPHTGSMDDSYYDTYHGELLYKVPDAHNQSIWNGSQSHGNQAKRSTAMKARVALPGLRGLLVIGLLLLSGCGDDPLPMAPSEEEAPA